MERLEAAIKKARSQQGAAGTQPGTQSGTQSGTLARPAAPGRSGATAANVEAAWDALQRVRLDRETLTDNRIVAIDPSPAATPFDVLRTRTLRHLQENGWRRLAITSATPECGKSTLALNMGLSLARQPKLRTVSLELDMRRPSQQRLLGLDEGRPAGQGMSESARLLTGAASFEDVAMRVSDNYALVTNSCAQKDASDVLLDDHIGPVLKDIETRYRPDVMIFDFPPVLLTDDSLAFMRHIDCALIVAAAESSSVAEIDRCERELAAQTNIMGVVLNKCRLATDQYDPYSYQYGY